MQILQIGTIVRPLTLTAEVTIGLCAFSGHVGVLKRAQDNVAESGQHVKSHPNDASVGEKKSHFTRASTSSPCQAFNRMAH